MTPPPRARGVRTAALAVLVALPIGMLPPATATAPPGPAARAVAATAHGQGDTHRADRAEEALAAAVALFAPRGEVAARAATQDGPTPAGATAAEPTLVMRDLALAVDDLDGPQRRQALRILARPTDGGVDQWPGVKYGGAPTDSTCATTRPDHAAQPVCVHWVTDPAHDDAPPLDDDDGMVDGDGVPDWVETNQRVFGEVWQQVVDRLGYLRPLTDEGTTEADGRIDIYLAELVREEFAVYGYCVPVTAVGAGAHQRSAYCVVDDDFAEFPGSAVDDLSVTAAHEFFHVVQFRYNALADPWLMEGTAAWVEDEVYDHIDDNLQYLKKSQLRYPGMPLDIVPSVEVFGMQHFNWRYGSWIWWRFLGEYFGRGPAADPSVVRQVWQRLARNGVTSMSAMRTVLASRGASFGAVYADFGAVNRIARHWYTEGRSYTQFVADPSARVTLSPADPEVRRRQDLNHLTTRHTVLRPADSLRGAWRLRVELDLPPRIRGSQAHVTVHRRDGRIRILDVRLDLRGDGRLVVPFGAREVSAVAVSLTNASTRIVRCGDRRSPFSCHGWSLDDRLPFRFTAAAVR